MFYRLSAEAVLLIHLSFIVFVILGGLLTARWRWVAALHLPSAAWACYVELSGRVCPLTYIENYLWSRSGRASYSQGFIEHYLLPIIYPAGLTSRIQIVLGIGVVLVNALIYGWLFVPFGKVRRAGGINP